MSDAVRAAIDETTAQARTLYIEMNRTEWDAATTGTPEALTREFAKVRPNAGWLLRAQWVLLGFVLLGLLKPVADLATGVVTTVLAMVPGLEGLAYLLLAVLINTSYLIPALIAYLLVRRLRLDPTRLEGWLQRFDFRGWWGFGLGTLSMFVSSFSSMG